MLNRRRFVQALASVALLPSLAWTGVKGAEVSARRAFTIHKDIIKRDEDGRTLYYAHRRIGDWEVYSPSYRPEFAEEMADDLIESSEPEWSRQFDPKDARYNPDVWDAAS